MSRGLLLHTGTLGVLGAFLLAAAPLAAQSRRALPGDDEVRSHGQGVAPVFEGWYEDPDGEGYILSFGYMNRNGEELVDLPAGSGNHLSPARFDGLQPTHFLPRRWWGVFAVAVPEDFGRDDVVWTIDFRGERYEIPGRITSKNYRIDALHAPATGLTPPALRFQRSGQEARGPRGIRAQRRTAGVGQPLELVVWTRDDTWKRRSPGEGGDGGTEAPEPRDVTLRWYRFSGPGEVDFSHPERVVRPRAGIARATTRATFAEPGEYVLYVRADNEPMRRAGMEQCCWTNGYVGVTVSP